MYTDVPGLGAPYISDKFKIEVRSAATNNQWIPCETFQSVNRANEVPDIDETVTGERPGTVIQGYQKYTRGWSHAFANIEMSRNTAVEVRVSLINGFNIQQSTGINEVNIHPAQKVFNKSFTSNTVTFTLYDPCQVVIDINGQMDKYNKAIEQPNYSDLGDKAYTTHTVSFFANPVMVKPAASGGTRIHYVEPGADYVALRNLNVANYDMIYFKPGVHDMGLNFKVKTGKKYFIPGDAIVFGTFNNLSANDIWTAETPGIDVRIFGYGILSGAKITHPDYVLTKAENDAKKDKVYKAVTMVECVNAEVYGITVSDPSGHSINLNAENDGIKETFVRWAKVITWRANGDGIGSATVVEDCFIRSADDASYVKGDRKRLTFWKDANAANFHMGCDDKLNMVIEDIDIIYNRTRGISQGGVFDYYKSGDAGEIYTLHGLFQNITVHDPRSNMFVFNLNAEEGGGSLNGFNFNNIDIKVDNKKFDPAEGDIMQLILGSSRSPWSNINLNNVTIAGRPITWADFRTNNYKSNVTITTSTQNINVSVQGNGGSVSGGASNITHYSLRTVNATPAANYVFKFWTENGRVVSLDASYTFNVTKSRNLVAHFKTGIPVPQFTISTSSSPVAAGSVTGGGKYNEGSSIQVCANANTGYKFDNWTVDGNPGSASACTTVVVTKNISMLANYSVSTKCTLSVVINPSAGGTVSGAGAYDCGSNVTLTATALAGYKFDNWTEGGNIVAGAGAIYTFQLNGNRTLTANFSLIPNCALPWSNATGYKANKSTVDVTTSPIDISCAPNGVTISMNLEGVKTDAQDYCNVYYKVDGGAQIKISENTGAFAKKLVSVSGVKGNSVVIIIKSATSYADEFYYITNLSVAADKSCAENLPWSTPDVTVNSKTLNTTYGPIDISCATSVKISLEAQGIGTDASDYCRIYYKVNGGTQVALVNKTGAFAKQTFTSPNISGNTLELVFSVKTSAASETFKITNIKVTSNGLKSADELTSIEEIVNSLATGAHIYPNPTSNILNIEFANSETSKEIRVFDNVGQMVYTAKTNDANTQLDVQSLNLKGIVIVQIISGQEVSNHKVLIK